MISRDTGSERSWVGSFLMGALVLVLLMSHAPAEAQVGSLTVRVEDAASLETLPGVSILLTSESYLVAPTTVRTNKDGEAQFPVLKAGSGYVLEISAPGYGRQRVLAICAAHNEGDRLQRARSHRRWPYNRAIIELHQAIRRQQSQNHIFGQSAGGRC